MHISIVRMSADSKIVGTTYFSIILLRRDDREDRPREILEVGQILWLTGYKLSPRLSLLSDESSIPAEVECF
jgi:hypothetical protein